MFHINTEKKPACTKVIKGLLNILVGIFKNLNVGLLEASSADLLHACSETLNDFGVGRVML